MTRLISFLLCMAFGLFMLWLGIWVMLVGGIVNIVDGVKADPTDGWLIFKGLLTAFFFEIPAAIGGVACFMSFGLLFEGDEV